MTSASTTETVSPPQLRERVLDAAAELFTHDGWRRTTMAQVAARAQVSRQSVYNEFGTKQSLAEELVARELGHFLGIVSDRFSAESDFVDGVRGAVLGALEAAETDELLRTVLESGHTGDAELLPLILQSQTLIDTATDFLRSLVTTRHPSLRLTPDQLGVVLESVVRLVLSHLIQPARPPARTAEDVAFLVGSLVRGVSVG